MQTAETAQLEIQESAVYASEILSARPALGRERLFGFARIFLLGILFAAPLAFGAVQPWAWGALAVAAALLFVVWAAGSSLGRTMRIYWSPIYLPAGAFLLLAAAQCLGQFTLDRAATPEALCKLVTDFVLFFLAGQLLAELAERQWRRIALAIALYTFALGVFATLQFFSSHNLIYWTIPSPGYTFGPYVNHNHYAGLMEMLIPLSAASVLSRPRVDRDFGSRLGNRTLESGGVLLGFAVLIPVASLLLSGSRGGFISLVAEVVLAALFIFLHAPRRARRTAAAVGCTAIIAAALLFFWMAPRQIAERLATMADVTHPREVPLAERLIPAKDCLRILRDYPWLGAGLGSFETVFPRYQSFPSNSKWDYAHNDYAQAIAETGLAGGVLILSAMGLFLWLALGKASGEWCETTLNGRGRGGQKSRLDSPRIPATGEQFPKSGCVDTPRLPAPSGFRAGEITSRVFAFSDFLSLSPDRHSGTAGSPAAHGALPAAHFPPPTADTSDLLSLSPDRHSGTAGSPAAHGALPAANCPRPTAEISDFLPVSLERGPRNAGYPLPTANCPQPTAEISDSLPVSLERDPRNAGYPLPSADCPRPAASLVGGPATGHSRSQPKVLDSFAGCPAPTAGYGPPTADCPLPTAYFFRLGAAIGCCGLLVHSFIDFNLHIPANAAWFAVCAAIATCKTKAKAQGASL